MDLGTLGGTGSTEAKALNDSGTVVGNSYVGSGQQHGFLWTPTTANGYTGSMTDVNSLTFNNAAAEPSGYYFQQALGINSGGSICGIMYNGTANYHAYLLVPSLPGDVNLDGKIDINDLTAVLTNFGQTSGMTWNLGDVNGDGKVDINDLTTVLTNFGQTSAGAGGPARFRSRRSRCWLRPCSCRRPGFGGEGDAVGDGLIWARAGLASGLRYGL